MGRMHEGRKEERKVKVSWTKQKVGFDKFNIDGAAKGKLGPVGKGGVV